MSKPIDRDKVEDAIDAPAETGYNHRRGRPSASERLQIEDELRPYFERNIGAAATASLTGYDIKTVYNYFNNWTGLILESINPEFVKRCNEEKERTLFALDNELDLLYQDRDKITKLMESATESGNLKLIEKLYNLKLKTTDRILSVHYFKINLSNTPTFGNLIDFDKVKNTFEN